MTLKFLKIYMIMLTVPRKIYVTLFKSGDSLNKTVLRCLSPFDIETHIPLEKSVWADFSC